MIETGIRTRILGQAAAPQRERRLRLVSALIVGASVTVFVLVLRATGLFELWELRTQDLRTRWTVPASAPAPASDIFLLMITDDSIRLVKEQQKMSYPWDWDVYALFLNACAQGKSASVLVDLLLLEDREGAEDLASALKSGPPAFLAAGFYEEKPPRKPEAAEEEALRRFSIEVDSDGSVRIPDPYRDVILPAGTILPASAGFCSISTPRDDDGMIRRYGLLAGYKGRIYPTFALAALLARERVKSVKIRNRVLTVGSVSFPVDRDGAIRLRYYAQGTTFPWRDSIRVLARMSGREPGAFDPAALAGKTVVLGTNALGLTDLRVTPVSKVMPGPEIHAVALANVLSGDALRDAPGLVSAILVAVAALGLALATRFSSAAIGGAAAAGAILALALAGVGLFKAGRVIELVPPTLAAGLSYAAASAVNFLYEGRQRQRIKRDFQRYMSPKVVEKILKNPDALSLKGERKLLTIFFMDFAGFTSVSEKVEPEEMVKLISDYHNEAAEEIFATEGTVDKYVGDLIMAFWNDPIDQEDHALRACLSAIAAQKRLKKMAVMMKDRGLPEMTARIGLNTGFAIVGNMGARNQVNYTVIGDEVNLASRLEGVNKEFGTDIIISEATWLPCKDRLEVRELALIKVKGRKHPVRIFELLGLKGEVAPERIQAARVFEGALRALQERRFAEAWETFTTLAQKGDAAADVYAEVCEDYRRSPPPPDWDKSYEMKGK